MLSKRPWLFFTEAEKNGYRRAVMSYPSSYNAMVRPIIFKNTIMYEYFHKNDFLQTPHVFTPEKFD
jgi:hypothetical protein